MSTTAWTAQLTYTIHAHVQNDVRCCLYWRLDSVAMIQCFDIWSGWKRSSRFEHNNNIGCNHITLDWKLWFNQSVCRRYSRILPFPSNIKKMWIENYERIHFVINVAECVGTSLDCFFDKFNFIHFIQKSIRRKMSILLRMLSLQIVQLHLRRVRLFSP